MSTTTSNLGLFKYDTTNPTDLASAFNINTALNANWDIIDNAITHVDRLPDQTDKSGYILTTNGSEASWGSTNEVYPVIETYYDLETGSWYRIYATDSTGFKWCEQGGSYSTAAGYITVDLLKPYINSLYEVFISREYVQATDTAFVSAYNKNYNSFSFYLSYANYRHFWHTCGYIK